MKLSVVATPIGNLEDITLRALRTLTKADVVACEDTRVTKKLLSHFSITTPVVSFHANSGVRGFDKIIKLLEEGKHVALVSDAGTPGISDPGLELVSVVRERFSTEGERQLHGQKSSTAPNQEEKIVWEPPRTFSHPGLEQDKSVTIETIPGPSALAAALSVAGLRAPSFTFYGFLPHKKGRETLLNEIAGQGRASVFYESPHRIMKTLGALAKSLPVDRRIGVFRELTKIYEEHIVGSSHEVLDYFTKHPDKRRGEFVVVVEEDSKSRTPNVKQIPSS